MRHSALIAVISVLASVPVHAVDRCSALFALSENEPVPFIVEEKVHKEGEGDVTPGHKYWIGHSWDYHQHHSTYVLSDPDREASRERARIESHLPDTEPAADWSVTKELLAARFQITHAEGQALKWYQGDGFKQINTFLRSRAAGKSSVDENLERTVQLIDQVFARLPRLKKAMTVYRGMPLRAGGKIPQVGDIVHDAAPQSTASQKENADAYVFGLPGGEYPGVESETYEKMQSFDVNDLHINARASRLPKAGLRYVIHLPEGEKALTFEYFLYYDGADVVTADNRGSIKTEAEVFLARNRAFKVVKVDPPETVTTKARDENGAVVDASAQVYVVHLVPN